MGKLFRQTIYFLVITFVINTVGWTFNKEAVADVWFGEQHCQVEDDDHSSAEPEDHKTVSSKSPCNHWCYNVENFIGLLSQSALVMPEFSNEYSIQQSFVIHFYFPDGRFRPPRLLS
uniref:Uncharacterized protein n=1 Tax=Candidatus Nitrotoga fabula TaxID=2182327 RepID=A0A2X0QUW5_9PROT|nr:conserved protein of unknown function [Candidatus Nitrotoga fabula]